MHDYIFTIGSAILLFALVPSVRSKDKPALKTSLITGPILFIFAVTFYSLGLLFTSGITIASSALWLILAWQKWRKKK